MSRLGQSRLASMKRDTKKAGPQKAKSGADMGSKGCKDGERSKSAERAGSAVAV